MNTYHEYERWHSIKAFCWGLAGFLLTLAGVIAVVVWLGHLAREVAGK